MATMVFECGGGCGSTAHWTSVTGTCSWSSTGGRDGRLGYRVNPATSLSSYLLLDCPSATQKVIVARAYVRVDTVPNQSTTFFMGHASGGYTSYRVGYKPLTGHFHSGFGSGMSVDSGITPTLGQWYRFDIKIDSSGGTSYGDCSIDGTAQTQDSLTQATHYQLGFRCGMYTGATADLYFDDVSISQTSGDYPLGAGKTPDETYPSVDVCAATGSALAVVAAECGIAAASSATATAQTATVSTTGGLVETKVYPDASAATGTARTSVAAGAILPGVTAATGAVYAPLLSEAPAPAVASASATAFAAFAAAASLPGAAGATGAAPVIASVLQPVWVSPGDGESIGQNAVLRFTVPADQPKADIYCRIDLDTVPTFDSGNLRSYATDVSVTGWEWYNLSSAWEAVPANGLSWDAHGRDVRLTVPDTLATATWYRRVRVGSGP